MSALSVERSNNFESLKQRASTLRRQRDDIADLIAPTSFRGKFRLLVAYKIPGLRGVLIGSPMATMREELRGSAIGLYQDMRDMLKEGRERVKFHENLVTLIDEVNQDPKAEEKLRDLLRNRAEASMGINKDSETEQLLSTMLEGVNQDQLDQRKAGLLAEAKQLAMLSKPVIEVTKAAIVGTATLYDRTLGVYSQLMELGPSLDLLHRNSGNILGAVSKGSATKELILAELEQAVKTAELVIEAARLGAELDQTRDIPRLERIKAEAEKILGEVPQLNSPQDSK